MTWKKIIIVVVCIVLFAGLLVYTMLDKGTTPVTKPTKEPTATQTVMSPTLSSSTVVGDVVSFGHYEQDDDPTTEDPLLWHVLEIKDGKALLISQDVLEVMIFSDYSDHSDNGKQSRWKYSIPREWLNGEFYSLVFSDEEKEKIVLATIETESLDTEGNPVIDTTEDKVFLLKASEVESLDEAIRKAQASLHARNQKVYVSGSARYWTRSMDNREYVGYYTNGDKVNFYVPGYEDTGVRPTMWVKMK